MGPQPVLELPFDTAHELYGGLQVKEDKSQRRLIAVSGKDALPGNSFVRLEVDDIIQYLTATLLTDDLDVFTPYLILVSTPASSSITSLHQQAALGRSIIVSSSADLHLVWYHDRIFVKPLPEFLLSHAFWTFVFVDDQNPVTTQARRALYRAAVGFVRTYAFLIRDELDFNLAVRTTLIPANVDVHRFVEFMRRFVIIPDAAVSPRYRYGELRLSRLNFWAPLALRRWDYFNTKRQSDSYFSRYFSPLLFMFAFVSVLLSAMQVALATEQLPTTIQPSWDTFAGVCKWTSVVAIILLAAAACSLAGIFMLRILGEIRFALKAAWRRRRV